MIKTRFSDMENSGKRIEWICDHGIGHHRGVHGCDGCCAHAPGEEWEKTTYYDQGFKAGKDEERDRILQMIKDSIDKGFEQRTIVELIEDNTHNDELLAEDYGVDLSTNSTNI